MGRPAWKGILSIKHVHIAVSLFPCVTEKRTSLRLLHQTDSGTLSQKYTCNVCDEEVPPEERVKGYEVTEDTFVVLTAEELESIKPEPTKVIETMNFCSFKSISSEYFNKFYALTPSDPVAEHGYNLVASVLSRKRLAGIVKFCMRDQETMAALFSRDKSLFMATLHWEEDVRRPEPRAFEKISQNTLTLAGKLVAAMTAEEFDSTLYHNRYEERMAQLVNSKVKGQQFVSAVPAKSPSPTADLTAALEASLKDVTA